MKNEKSTELAKVETTEKGLQVVDLRGGALPILADAQEVPIDLTSEYWTPEQAGESKRVYFDKIDLATVKDLNSDDMIELECAYFIEQVKEGDEIKIRRITNGSRRLVGALLGNKIQTGTPLVITYLGKKKNRSNNFHSDNWSIKPLMIKIS